MVLLSSVDVHSGFPELKRNGDWSFFSPTNTKVAKIKDETVDEKQYASIQDLLVARAESPNPGSLLFYPLGKTSSSPKPVSYKVLYETAKEYGHLLRRLASFEETAPVLIHLDDHWEAIQWFWAVVFANAIPVLSPPLSQVEDHRRKHLNGLSQLLESPICITKSEFLPFFEGSDHSLKLHTLESLLSAKANITRAEHAEQEKQGIPEDQQGRTRPAALMLTSGSTGNAKAVCLSHKQMLAAVAGKASLRNLPTDAAFLNWIGLDHVASLVEIHLQAIWVGVDQVHVHAADIVSQPPLFVELLSRHRVSRSFAPNFFLAKLVSSLDGAEATKKDWDLSKLTFIASGGEANELQICIDASALLSRYGAPPNAIATGFGMTETCAGAIYSLDCPDCDIIHGRGWASVGHCMKGIDMRITSREMGSAASIDEVGDLEVRGLVVFEGYYRNPAATSESFTSDGWFRTGDQASIDSDGNLCLTGRIKDVINLNGVKLMTADVQAALETALRDTCVTRVVTFPSRAKGAATEQITVAYIPRDYPPKAVEVAEVDKLATQACMMLSATCRPVILCISPKSLPLVPMTTLGKISGSKMRSLFEGGAYDEDAAYHRDVTEKLRQDRKQMAAADTSLTETEMLIRKDFAQTQGLEDETQIDIETTMFELGFASMDVVRLKHRIEVRLGYPVAAIVFMKHPTVRSLASALDEVSANLSPEQAGADSGTTAAGAMEAVTAAESEYDPVVTLRASGTKSPLWLVHPGVGEVLVFVGLAQHMAEDDRPIYALRARGFEPGQDPFSSIEETVDTYVEAIRRRQPHGPYALAGYSYGTMLSFEMTKRFNGTYGERVAFLGSFNLPPHIKMRMRQLQWNRCLMHLCVFLGLVSEDYSDKDEENPDSTYKLLERDQALRHVLAMADQDRFLELGLSPRALERWANVAFGLQSIAMDYEPSGSVQGIDVFHAEPLAAAAPSRKYWVEEMLSRWEDFSQTAPRFHEVGGRHYTMIGPDHVRTFAHTLRTVLSERGL